jgi:hypothetical protein
VGPYEGYVLLTKTTDENCQQILKSADYIRGSNKIIRKATNFLLRNEELCIQNSKGYFEEQLV